MENDKFNKRLIGAKKEKEACKYLEEQGYEILCCNFRCKFGEVDIIAREKNYLVFIEVKYRKNTKNGFPVEAVNVGKQKRIVITAKYYLLKQGLSEQTPCRFDIVELLDDKVSIIRDAFDAG